MIAISLYRQSIRSITLGSLVLLLNLPNLFAAPAESYDIVVYGGTSGGLIAGIQARAMGRSVVVIEPTDRIGGLTTGGLGQTDVGNKHVIGGLAREFYRRVKRYYATPAVWKWQPREAYHPKPQTKVDTSDDTMWTFEPSAALQIYEDWVAATKLKIIKYERLNRASGVRKIGPYITAITMESGRTFAGQMFIDATYEGDLMAAAGASYTVGREANVKYQETYDGVQTENATKHNLMPGIDPYIDPEHPESGLLPFIASTSPAPDGSGDARVQAYCFRMCLTDHPDNRIPFAKPEGYEELWYELLFRNYKAGYTNIPWGNSAMPNRKTDTNNRDGFSTDFIGQNYDYPEASYAERTAIVARHLRYQQGLMWTLANHPRIPEPVRREVSRWGVAKDEFFPTGGWPAQIYVREARRLVSEYVMTQHHCQGQVIAEDAIGMGAYTMDSHNVQRYVDAYGHVRNEGDVQIGGFPPYPISYRAIRPRKDECANLLVPFALSASHIAFGSIRMEPVFMILGQSAATAAAQAIDAKAAIQDIDYAKLRARLLADGQILAQSKSATH